MFDNLSDRLQGIFSGMRSKGRLTEEDIDAAMREIRMALLEADVNFKVVKEFVARTKERCTTAEVLESLTPAQNVTKVVLDELTDLLGKTDSKLVFGSRIPHVIMLVGLQGSGKTTAAAKLAYLLRSQNHNPLLVACDVYRPAAADQLQTLGDEMGVRVTVPPLAVCGDNAAMIGLVALRLIREGQFAPLTMDANPNLRLTHKD